MIQPLAFPKANLRLSKKNDALFVWCVSRKKKLLLTPEEWVRQHLIHYLVSEKKVPIGLVISEYAIKVNNLSRRCDVVVFGTDSFPKLIIECKAPEVPINHRVFHQIAQYNFQLNVDFLMLTNGLQHIICKIDRINNTFVNMEELPAFDMLNK